MHFLAGITSVILILAVLVDAFESTILPRQVLHRWRFVRLYYRNAWRVWRELARVLPLGKRRDGMLGWFGPLSVLGLFACWCVGLIFGFALLNWATGAEVHAAHLGGAGELSFGSYLYLSGVTLFTLGDIEFTPVSGLARVQTVVECGLGFGFLALMISYVPVLYQAFSRRETTISLLDARAGSPPSASEMLLAAGRDLGHLDASDGLLSEWKPLVVRTARKPFIVPAAGLLPFAAQ